MVPGRMKEVPLWFPGARLNYSENILRNDGDAIAVTAARETGVVVHYSFRQLRELVRDMAAAMRVHGLQKGDRVAGTHPPLCTKDCPDRGICSYCHKQHRRDRDRACHW